MTSKNLDASFPQTVSPEVIALASEVIEIDQREFIDELNKTDKTLHPEKWVKLKLRQIAYRDQSGRVDREKLEKAGLINSEPSGILTPEQIAFGQILTTHWANGFQDIDAANRDALRQVLEVSPLEQLIQMREAQDEDQYGQYFAAAWLVTQHADRAPEFQMEMLERFEDLRKRGIISPCRELAYLTDRVLSNAGKKQRYGTQGAVTNGTWQPFEVENPEEVDKLRAEVYAGTGKDPTLKCYVIFMRSGIFPILDGKFEYLPPKTFKERGGLPPEPAVR